MLKVLTKFIITYAAFIVVFILQKLIFLACYHSDIDLAGAGDVWNVVRHGFSMDCAMAGYLTAIPGLLYILEVWIYKNWVKIAEKVYFWLISFVLTFTLVLDLLLYDYWGFRLDATPLFYFATAPAASFASAKGWEIFIGIAATGVITGIMGICLSKIADIRFEAISRPKATALLILLTALLFIPIRGGFTVSTMNPSHAYFSPNQGLNHAAINPQFNLLYSLTHQTSFDTQYRFMDEEDVMIQLEALEKHGKGVNNSTIVNLTTQRPDIYLIILESFSAHLMPSLGGEAVAVNLDKLASEGVLFTNFYANGFRTDRALPAILSGFPSQPSTSVMKFVDKASKLPSISASLKDAGYNTAYYYGGDANFTNMNAYLVNSGFDKIVSDKDFTISEKASKWGAPDHHLFARALADATPSDKPRFTVIQTSSSHEPFEVPYSNPRFADNAPKNAFAYTDSCLMAFIDGIKQGGNYANTLFVMVPDHQGCWPTDIKNPADRHHVPLVLAGGALTQSGLKIGTPASQTDIAATLLSLLGLNHSDFEYSHDILDSESPHYGLFVEPSLIGIVSSTDSVYVNTDTGLDYLNPDETLSPLGTQAKAFLQNLYNNLQDL